jgi:hypothetical protein
VVVTPRFVATPEARFEYLDPAETDADGRVRFDGLPEGTYRLEVAVESGASCRCRLR